MKSHILEQLKLAGNNIDEYLDRFEGDEETCEMLVSMFTQDGSFKAYLDSYAEGNYSACREHAHSIKGAAANVGLSLLSSRAFDVMIAIDRGSFDSLPELNEAMSVIYYETIKILTE